MQYFITFFPLTKINIIKKIRIRFYYFSKFINYFI